MKLRFDERTKIFIKLVRDLWCEHILHSKKSKFAIRDHIELGQSCQRKQLDVNNFEVIRTCNSEYETKIQEALLIKKFNPQLNKQLYAKESSCLLSVY